MNPKIYAYLRVSTVDQTLENSKLLIYDYLNKNGLNTTNLEFVCEKKSGYKFGYKERLIGTNILPRIKKGDILIVSTLSRISRKLRDILKFVEEEVGPKDFKMIVAKNNLTIDNSPLNKLLITMLATCAEFEIDVLRERTKQGIKRYKLENNGKWGRRKGEGSLKLDPYLEEIKKLLKMGIKYKSLADKYKVCPNTISNFVKRHGLRNL
jgi:DNA invertase Pin-like site-specific DNA recombinase